LNFCSKIEILVKDLNFGLKSKFSPKIKILTNNNKILVKTIRPIRNIAKKPKTFNFKNYGAKT